MSWPKFSRKLTIVVVLSCFLVLVLLRDLNISRRSQAAEGDDILLKAQSSNASNNSAVIDEGNSSASAGPQDETNDGKLDFAIIGFPKTGTTTLLQTFLKHNETAIAEIEFCGLYNADNGAAVYSHVRSLREAANHSVKVGIKCPTMARKSHGMKHMANLFNDTRLVVGVRHPVLWFQSFYNYRVQESHNLNLPEPNGMPSPIKLAYRQWHGLSAEDARFELFLMQLAKVPLTSKEVELQASMRIRKTSNVTNPFKIFIFATEQLSDQNATRQEQLRTDLQNHLRLKLSIDRLVHANKSGNRHHPETINICDEKYRKLRRLLMRHGQLSSSWILEKFIQSEDVVVSNREHFTSLLKQWGEDPCEN